MVDPDSSKLSHTGKGTADFDSSKLLCSSIPPGGETVTSVVKQAAQLSEETQKLVEKERIRKKHTNIWILDAAILTTGYF